MGAAGWCLVLPLALLVGAVGGLLVWMARTVA